MNRRIFDEHISSWPKITFCDLMIDSHDEGHDIYAIDKAGAGSRLFILRTHNEADANAHRDMMRYWLQH